MIEAHYFKITLIKNKNYGRVTYRSFFTIINVEIRKLMEEKMSTWTNFSILADGMSLSDTIDAFFEYADNMGIDHGSFLEGIDYLMKEQKFILVMLICVEVMLTKLSNSNNEKVDAKPVIILFEKITNLMKEFDQEETVEIKECLEDIRAAYPNILLILSDDAAHV